MQTLGGDYDDIKKVTIVPRGPAGGVTYFMPSADRVDSGLLSRQHLEDQLSVALGGRVAEEVVFGPQEVTTGAASDMEHVYRIARMMVTAYGFSEQLGPIAWPNPATGLVSDTTSLDIDNEVKRIVAQAYMRTTGIIQKDIEKLQLLARTLVEKETLNGDQVAEVLG